MNSQVLPSSISLVALACCVASTYASSMSPVSQQRSVFAFADAGDDDCGMYDSDSDSISAPDFGPFDEFVAVVVNVCDGSGESGAYQTSTMAPASVHATGSANAYGEGFSSLAYGAGNGSSSFRFTFTVSDSTDAVFEVYLAAYDMGEAYASLYSGDDALIEHEAYGPFAEIDQTHNLTLPPGEYTLRAGGFGAADGTFFLPGYAFSEYTISFSVEATCSGDLDDDGDTDQSDLGILLGAYGKSADGDLDGDLDTDQADLGVLLADYGCGL